MGWVSRPGGLYLGLASDGCRESDYELSGVDVQGQRETSSKGEWCCGEANEQSVETV